MDEEDVEDGMEPEECEAFILEHHHEQLPYFGDECSYHEEIPATWRNLLPVEGNCPDWFRRFAHEARFQPKWEELCFRECEKLYTLASDEAILYHSMLDVMNSSSRCTRSMVQEARENFLKVQGELREQRKLVFELFQWALEPCGSCDIEA
ncbi:hypothetical protein NPX13_g1369 [Xylaria arbuscula]|uniref:Uncharacterized protein n=1 Tax=Xylaria arbuscula TaxID=114810 RepID=A0A9W8TRB5_9PEZI|nr:hypothetical protein NPX13_g1369 [Xylaria arbuscula]